MSKKNSAVFKWEWSQTNKIFPIDFTSQDLATLLDPAKKSNASTNSLQRAINATGLSVLQSIHSSGIEKPRGFSIPLEAAPLFGCLMELAQDKAYKVLFDNNFVGNSELQARFIDELCLKLYKETEKSERSTAKYIDTTFFHHVLFQNERFLESIVTELWKDKISTRFQELQNLAKQRQLGSQLDIFIDCLTSLDSCILKLKTRCPSSFEEDRGNKKIFEQMLYQFLSARKPDSTMDTSSKIRYYWVKNIPVGNQAMSEVFTVLQRQPSKDLDLKYSAQKCYLEDIAKDLENIKDAKVQQALQAEHLYDDVLRYLEITSSNITKSALQDIIEERCIYQCGTVVDYCTFDTSRKMPPFFSIPNYTTTLLDRLIQERINSKLSSFRDTIQYMAFYSAVASGSWRQRQYCIVRLEQYLNGNTPEIPISQVIDRPMEVETAEQNPYYDEMSNFLKFFEQSWAFLHNVHIEDGVRIFDKESMQFVDKETLVNELFCVGSKAAAKLNRANLMFPSLDETCNALNCYEYFIHNLKIVQLVYRYHHTISRLFLMILMAILCKITQDLKESLLCELALLPGVNS